MSILHGSWLKTETASYLFVWGEVWRSTAEIGELETKDLPPLNPFCCNVKELVSLFKSRHLRLAFDLGKQWQYQRIFLPSHSSNQEGQIVPVLSNQLSLAVREGEKISFSEWQVQGIALTALEAIEFLQQLPLNLLLPETKYIGGDLQFWTHIYRWHLDIFARSKFVPGIARGLAGQSKSQWYPLLDSTLDRSRLAKFAQAMPPVCRSYCANLSGNDELESQELLLDFLINILATQLRYWINSASNIVAANVKYPWLLSFGSPDEDFSGTEAEVKRLETAFENWTLPIREYLVTETNKQLGKNQFQTCFRLEPPANSQTGEANWKLAYYLQALDDANFLVEAEAIWCNPVETMSFNNRYIEQPQENFLKGLGLASHLYSPIAESLQESQPQYCELNPIQVYEFIRAAAWQLEDSGLGVILPPSLASGTAEKRLGLTIQAKVTPNKGERLSLKSLLNYELKLVIGGQVISNKEFEKLLAQKSPLVEMNGEWIALQPADVRAAQAILKQSHEPIQLTVEDALRLSTGDVQAIAKLPVIDFQASGILQELINNLTNNQRIEPIANPQGFRGELRPYQARGVGWLAFLEQWGLGACLADDMGLGKTPQLLAFLLHLKAQDLLAKPTLVIAPTSVLNNWEREVEKFAPTLSTLVHHGSKRRQAKTFLREVKNKDLVITSYALVYRDGKTLEAVAWQGVVLDEAQNIKNPQAKQAQAVHKIKAEFRIALTGTPVENRLAELWSILDFLNPGFLGTQQFFQRRFATPIEKYGDRESLQVLRSLVQPFILRRLKTDTDIVKDLPQKQEMDVFCGLSLEQAELYQNLVTESLNKIESTEGIQRKGLILTLLLKLKQICNHPAQFLKEKSLKSGDRSGKVLRLEEMLEELIEEGDRALIFTQFAEWGKLLQPYLQKKLGCEILFLYGATERQKRQEMIDRFQNDPDAPPIFILSLKAGGTGLNLTKANHVFHVDRWWNPAVENQATDRAFRIGQKQNVQVHKFICTGTIEEKINDILASKKELAEQTISAGEQWLTSLDTERLRHLLLLDRQAIIDD
jgi:SNF2 family DNA or RNA helicase